ncbi:hypothetical protein KY328_00975 [Candidatus Woesearchaeota archaeon]|nr:hypothetical protein [Candidatus Woesearchaeota archaeon]MBW3021469.1 hypothetical protein [Candidatus Woesearchaeota archaeon]
MKGRLDFLETALTSNNPETRRLSKVIQRIIDMNSTVEGTRDYFMLNILGTADAPQKAREYIKSCLARDAKAEEIRKSHPVEDAGYLAWYDEFMPNDPDIQVIDRNLKESLKTKEEIFADLAPRLRNMMRSLFCAAHIRMALDNYDTAQEIVSHVDGTQFPMAIESVQPHLSAMKSALDQPPGLTKLEALASIAEAFSTKCYAFRSADVPQLGRVFKSDAFQGRMCDSYIQFKNGFFQEFDWRAQPREYYDDRVINFYLHGMLEGEYSLIKNPRVAFKGIEYPKDYGTTPVWVFSPVHFSVQLPSAFREFVVPVFKKIEEDYKDRIAEPSELIS